MKQMENGAIYRVCARNEGRWDVLRGSSAEPLATFKDKHAALEYAMNMARTRSNWGLPLLGRQDVLRSICNQSRIHD